MPPCPCHSGKLYADCCQSYHLGLAPDTALALMRSRYAAYAFGLVDYIITTTHSSQKPCSKEIKSFCNVTHFSGLEILNVKEAGSEATIKFKAILYPSGFENEEFNKETPQIFWLERGAMSIDTTRSEDIKYEAKSTKLKIHF